ncbi:MAG: cytochrome c oxidase subunit II [Oscillatoriophycideae cyanobacterium NC_groundwater_1537_Pr4_S-0.65um_50_18]|nr:cytochrome c oxidase subunit II [Oscillatoriophycideae cyanobacterium NC_groundwater_1537_Pr4_S-0.65um_50_18]
MKIPSNILTMLAGILLTLVSIWYGKNHGLMPVQASSDAALVDGLFDTMMIISTAIFLLVWGVLIICLLKFRRQPGDETDGPAIEGNIPLEIVWTAIPVVIVLVLGVYSFDVYNSMGGFDPDAAGDPGVQVAMASEDGTAMSLMDAAPKKAHHNHMALGIGASPQNIGSPPDLTVNVLGMQYAWIYTYPDLGITTGELHVPANKNVRLNLKSQDVIHAFWLPEFRIKQDTIPGMESELRFTPTRVGDYPIVCAELCGAYHGGMASRLYVQAPEDYDKWVQEQMPAPESDSQTAADLEKLMAAPTGEKRSDADYLVPVAHQMGLDAQTLDHLHHTMPMPSDALKQVSANLATPAA